MKREVGAGPSVGSSRNSRSLQDQCCRRLSIRELSWLYRLLFSMPSCFVLAMLNKRGSNVNLGCKTDLSWFAGLRYLPTPGSHKPITDFPSTQTSIARAECISPCTCRCKSERRSERVRKRHRERERYRHRPTDERADGWIIGIHVHPNI